MDDRLKLVYILPDYPLVTTTFVDREIMMLRRLGVDIEIVASRRPGPDVPLSAAQRSIQDDVLYLRPVSAPTLVLSHLYFILTAPRRFFWALLYLMTRSHPNLKAKVMTVLHFGRGVYAAYLLRRKRFHELHVHFAFGNAVSTLVIARLLDKSYTMSIHAGNDIFANPVLLHEKIMEARHVVTCTTYNKSYLEDLVNEDISAKVTFIPHGLDLAIYEHSSRPLGLTGTPLILSVGTLTERKGFVHLIRACRALKDKGYEFICPIVGEGQQRQELEKLIRELSLEGTVTLLGALRHEEVIEQYKNATIFVLPCIQSSTGDLDGIPNVVAEAMAMQVPVVSSHISGVPELVEHHVNGLLIRPGDEPALATAMAQLLDDSALRETLGQNALRTIHKEFDVENNTRRLAATLWPSWFQSTTLCAAIAGGTAS